MEAVLKAIINDKQVNIWRGSGTPPTIYHLWIRDETKLWLYNGTEWKIFLDDAKVIADIEALKARLTLDEKDLSDFKVTTQNNLNTKVDKTTTVNGYTLDKNISLVKADVGLGRVDNTNDIEKPLSTATKTYVDNNIASEVTRADSKYFHKDEPIPAESITETISKRFVTDADKLNWNNKADLSYVNIELNKKVNKITGTANGILKLDASGNPIADSGKIFNDDGESANDIWTAEKIIKFVLDQVTGVFDWVGMIDASKGILPTVGSGDGGYVMKADLWICEVAGTIQGVKIEVNNTITAKIDNPGQDMNNWLVQRSGLDYTAENVLNKETGVLTDSNQKYPSSKLVKDSLIPKLDKSVYDVDMQNLKSSIVSSLSLKLDIANFTFANLKNVPNTIAGYGIIDGATITQLNTKLDSSVFELYKTDINGRFDLKLNAADFTFNKLISHPTTIEGYGITDVYTWARQPNKPSYGFNEIGDGSFKPSDYLKLSGGTVTGDLYSKRFEIGDGLNNVVLGDIENAPIIVRRYRTTKANIILNWQGSGYFGIGGHPTLGGNNIMFGNALDDSTKTWSSNPIDVWLGANRKVWHSDNFNKTDYLLTSDFTFTNLKNKPDTVAGYEIRDGAIRDWENKPTDLNNRSKSFDGTRTGYQWTNSPLEGIASLKNTYYSDDWIEQEYTLMASVPRKYLRNFRDGTTWSPWYEFYHTGNFNPSNYLPLSGGQMTNQLSFSNAITNKPIIYSNARLDNKPAIVLDWSTYNRFGIGSHVGGKDIRISGSLTDGSAWDNERSYDLFLGLNRKVLHSDNLDVNLTLSGSSADLNLNQKSGFVYANTGTLNTPNGLLGRVLTLGYNGTTYAGQMFLAEQSNDFYIRTCFATTWKSWNKVWHDGNFNPLDENIWRTRDALAAGTNFNNLTNSGAYDNMVGNYDNNAPHGWSKLLNFNNGSYGQQLSFPLNQNTTESVKYRNRNEQSWGQWIKFWDSQNSNNNNVNWVAKELDAINVTSQSTCRVAAQNSGDGRGLSLYGASGEPNTYGMHFSLTSNFGKYGDVQGDWATYYCISGSGRGHIFRTDGTNIASISNNGIITAKEFKGEAFATGQAVLQNGNEFNHLNNGELYIGYRNTGMVRFGNNKAAIDPNLGSVYGSTFNTYNGWQFKPDGANLLIQKDGVTIMTITPQGLTGKAFYKQ